MKKENLKNILKQAIRLFVENDAHLFAVEINERSMTHKFAEYIQQEIGNGWNVDCEYNRNLGDVKWSSRYTRDMVCRNRWAEIPREKPAFWTSWPR